MHAVIAGLRGIEKPIETGVVPSFLHDFSGRFSIYSAPSGAKYCRKGSRYCGKGSGKGLGIQQFWKLNFQSVIKSAASAASLDLQGSPRTTARHAEGGARGLPCKFREAALAADLIMA